MGPHQGENATLTFQTPVTRQELIWGGKLRGGFLWLSAPSIGWQTSQLRAGEVYGFREIWGENPKIGCSPLGIGFIGKIYTCFFCRSSFSIQWCVWNFSLASGLGAFEGHEEKNVKNWGFLLFTPTPGGVGVWQSHHEVEREVLKVSSRVTFFHWSCGLGANGQKPLVCTNVHGLPFCALSRPFLGAILQKNWR